MPTSSRPQHRTLEAAGERWAAPLRERDLRVTNPRLAVLSVLDGEPHQTSEQIAAGARTVLGSVSTQAVYDVLHTLTSVGLLRRIEPAGSASRYETRVGDSHHHLVCRTCGAVHDVAYTTGPALCLDLSEAAGYAVDGAEVTFWGSCPNCRETEPDKGSSGD